LDLSELNERYQKLLAAVEAIECGAQSYNIDGQSVTKANLGTLYSRLKVLESQIRQQEGEEMWIASFMDRG
jgi:hypothetical protein